MIHDYWFDEFVIRTKATKLPKVNCQLNCEAGHLEFLIQFASGLVTSNPTKEKMVDSTNVPMAIGGMMT